MAYVLMQPFLYIGQGDPNGQVTANRGAACYRTDGGAGTTLYVKESGDGTSSGWTAVGAGGGGPATQIDANGDVLDVDAIADGQYLRRSGATVVGAGSGSDPWTYAALASDFPTTSGTPVAMTGLSFAPAANTRYEFEAVLFLQTATATVGPRPGLSWPTGISRNVAWAMAPTSLTAFVSALWGGTTAAAALSTGLAAANVDNPGLIRGALVAGATPSGDLQVTLQSESAGTTVRAMAGSFIKWRSF